MTEGRKPARGIKKSSPQTPLSSRCGSANATYCLPNKSWKPLVIYNMYRIQVATERKKRVEDEPSKNDWEISVKLPDGSRMDRKFPKDGRYQVKYI